jgi:hypothetical protein
MTRSSRVAALLLALAVLIVTPATMAVARVEHPVPIRGTSTGVDEMLPVGSCPEDADWTYRNTGTARFSHVGAAAFELTHCTWMEWETGAGVFGYGTTTITAANGDVLTLAHHGTFELAFGAEGPESSLADLEWVVTGGTGRFADATGSGTATAVGDLEAGTTTATYLGTIVYDASNRSAR